MLLYVFISNVTTIESFNVIVLVHFLITFGFLKNYISALTPYNNLLIYHETGVGKTCTMISILEQFKDLRDSLDELYLSTETDNNKIKKRIVTLMINIGYYLLTLKAHFHQSITTFCGKS